MDHLIVVILNNVNNLPTLLKRWREIGVGGATILKSEGGFAMETFLHRFGLDSLAGVISAREFRPQKTVISLINDESLLERAIGEAEDVVGGFDRPDSGLLFVLPVSRSLGLKKWGAEAGIDPTKVDSPPTTRFNRSMSVAQVIRVLDLEPVIVSVSGTLEEALELLLLNSRVRVASVVNESGHLVGLLDSQRLAEGLLVDFFPEEFMADLHDLERMIKVAARSRLHRVSDLMEDPVSVHLEDSIKEAFHRMYRHRLTGLPVVDDRYQVIGQINLMELLAVCMQPAASARDSEGES